MIKNITSIFLLSFIALTLNSCRKSYNQQDLKLFSGNWTIEKVDIDGTIIENYGTIIIDENGIGKMTLNYYPYNDTTASVQGIFNLSTSSGIDYYVKLYGAFWLNPDGSPGHMMCDQESEISVRVTKIKKKSMEWEFAETTSIYDCDLRQNSYGNMTNVKWYLKRQ